MYKRPNRQSNRIYWPILLTALLRIAVGTDAGTKKPNVVILLADDLGWSDISHHGGMLHTPAMDSIFQQGAEFLNFMVTAVCSPSRAGLLTGRHPHRVGISPSTVNADWGITMRSEEYTLAEAFQSAGYRTALIGKWHLGYHPGPNEQGFDYFYGCMGAAVDYFHRTRKRDGTLDWQENGQAITAEGYTTDLLRDRCVAYIENNAAHPFFLFVSFTAVHNPLQAPGHYLKRVDPSVTDPKKRTYLAMTIALDDAVRGILTALDANALSDNTIVVFFSDNGATPTGSNLPFRDGKHSLYEGGVHSPFAIRWPGKIPTGVTYKALHGVEDLYPSLCAMCGIATSKGFHRDGMDFSPYFVQEAGSPRAGKASYAWCWLDYDAIRTSRWKLIRRTFTRELYDLRNDPAETHDIAGHFPDRVRRLEADLDRWHASIPSYPSHVPVKSPDATPPAPGGTVLEISVHTCKDKAQSMFHLDFSRFHLQVQPGDRFEYDMKIHPDSIQQGFQLEIQAGNPPWRAPGKRHVQSFFRKWHFVDQHGTALDFTHGFPQASGRWAHRVIGLANLAPRPVRICRMLFSMEQEAACHLYLDNLIVRRANGDIVNLYRNGDPTNLHIPASASYQDVIVKSIPVQQAEP